jgi:hypothetical protein
MQLRGGGGVNIYNVIVYNGQRDHAFTAGSSLGKGS